MLARESNSLNNFGFYFTPATLNRIFETLRGLGREEMDNFLQCVTSRDVWAIIDWVIGGNRIDFLWRDVMRPVHEWKSCAIFSMKFLHNIFALSALNEHTTAIQHLYHSLRMTLGAQREIFLPIFILKNSSVRTSCSIITFFNAAFYVNSCNFSRVMLSFMHFSLSDSLSLALSFDYLDRIWDP